MSEFIHLRTHSQYSFDDGLLSVKEPKKKSPNSPKPISGLAASDGQSAVALTDLHGMFGVIGFYTQARKDGVKPIIGSDVRIEADVTEGGATPGIYRVNILCENDKGYKRLMELITRSNIENLIQDKGVIKQSWLTENNEGMLILSGDAKNGELCRLFHDETTEEDLNTARNIMGFYNTHFPGRYYLEVQRYAQPHEKEQVDYTVQLADEQKIPVVATHPVVFASRKNYFAHEARVAIKDGKNVFDINRDSGFTREQYFKSQEEMKELFQDLPDALENSVRIGQRCSLEIILGKSYLPRFPTPDNLAEDDYFAVLSREGLQERLELDFPKVEDREAHRKQYEDRLEYEIGVIQKMGFSGYFLIVSDFINWAKRNDIPIGPGRGSGAGSLVAYSLKITNLNPLPNNLLFERFLNPDRVSMPDFDIDIEMFRREEVIGYVRNKYGDRAVSQISAFGTSAAKKTIRDVVRTMGMPYFVGDRLAKMISNAPGITLDKALEESSELRDLLEKDPQVQDIFETGRLLEGSVTNISTHAAGVLISPGQISDFSPVHFNKANTKGKEDAFVSHFNKDDVEQAGLVKFDFLGLATLSVIQHAQKLIEKRPEFEGKVFDPDRLDTSDPKVYELFARGDTISIFQFESSGMQQTLRQAVPNCFADLVALTSLYRPGPKELIPTYIDRKFGRKPIEYPDPRTEEVLKETYGIMVYQEQVMQVAQILGGYSLGGADILRRAMGKKNVQEMEENREIFAEGASKNGLSREQADNLFDMIEMFSGYGFNKSHAAAYSMLSFQTAYIKHYYPLEFFTAVLNVGLKDGDKPQDLSKVISDMRAHGISLLPPDINKSNALFDIVAEENAIRFGLAAAKGLGIEVIDKLVYTRSIKGEFDSFIDFLEKMGPSDLNKSLLEVLINIGAFDTLEPNRTALNEVKAEALKYNSALATYRAKTELIDDDFGFGELIPEDGKKPKKKKVVKELVKPEPPIINSSLPSDESEVLNAEFKFLELYISAHPFDLYAKKLQGIPSALPLNEVDSITPEKFKVYLIAGVVTAVKEITTKAGEKMGFLTISDGRAEKEVVVFNHVYAYAKDYLKTKNFIAMEVNIDPKQSKEGEEEGLSIKAKRAFSLESYEAHQARQVFLALEAHEIKILQQVSEKFKKNPERDELDMKVTAYVPFDEKNYNKIDFKTITVPNNKASIQALRETFGANRVALGFARDFVFTPPPPKNWNNNQKKSYK